MANVYRFVKDVYDGQESYKIYTASGVSEGDFMQWDPDSRLATNNLLASGSIFLGVAQDANPLAGLGTPTNPLTGGMCRIKSNGIHSMNTTSSEVYSHLDPVFEGADAQTVSKVGSTRMVGRVWLPDGTQVTGASGTTVNVSVYGSMTNNSTVPSAATAAR